jgi:tRNA(Arg) A34 adenosine deaminase TadA
MQQTDFMRAAIALSAQSQPAAGDQPFGAVVVKDGEIVGRGRNRAGSACDPTAHSEILAIRDACANLGTSDLSGCELYASGEPCPMCAGAIWWARLARVTYGAAMAQAEALGLGCRELCEEIARPTDARRVPSARLLTDEAVAVLRRWAEKASA